MYQNLLEVLLKHSHLELHPQSSNSIDWEAGPSVCTSFKFDLHWPRQILRITVLQAQKLLNLTGMIVEALEREKQVENFLGAPHQSLAQCP